MDITHINQETQTKIIEAALQLARWGDALDDPADLPAIMKDVQAVIAAAYVSLHTSSEHLESS